MATHSTVLGWRIPGTGEPGGLCLVSGLVTEISLGEASEVPGRSGHKFWALCFTTIILPLQWGKEKLSQVQ